jgi:hypothetical protein
VVSNRDGPRSFLAGKLFFDPLAAVANFLDRFFTADLDLPVLLRSQSHNPARPATRARSWLRPRVVCFFAFAILPLAGWLQSPRFQGIAH